MPWKPRNAQTKKGSNIAGHPVNQVLTKLEEVCFGTHYFQVGGILRNAYFVSSMLTNVEAWYGLLTTADIKELEKMDEHIIMPVYETVM